jgi:hypothetical protein
MHHNAWQKKPDNAWQAVSKVESSIIGAPVLGLACLGGRARKRCRPDTTGAA